MSEAEIEVQRNYFTSVQMCWRAECVSPISGNRLEAYGSTPTEAKQRIDMQVLGEANARGMRIERTGFIEPEAV